MIVVALVALAALAALAAAGRSTAADANLVRRPLTFVEQYERTRRPLTSEERQRELMILDRERADRESERTSAEIDRLDRRTR